MELTSAFNALPTIPRKQVLKSFIGSLNSSIIGNLRAHIRNSKYESISSKDSAPTIDDYNDAKAEDDVAIASRRAFEDAGIAQVATPLEVAKHMETLRVFCINQLSQLASHPADVSLTLDDTLDFQINRQPDINEPVLKSMALALNIDVEALRAAKIKITTDDRDELIQVRGQITSLATSFVVDEDDAAIDAALDALPAHVQYKLWASLATALKRAGDKALAALLRYNRLDSAGDITMIKAVYNDVALHVAHFSTARSHDLHEYLERGGQLPEVALMA